MGSGKSTVADQLRQIGFEVLDADAFARDILRPGSLGEAEVLRSFGQGLVGKDGRLDRAALGRLVFADSTKLQQLEKLIHPLVRAAVAARRAELEAAGHSAAFYDVPLLFEKNMAALFDHVLVVNAPEAVRNARVKARSKLSDEEILLRNSRHLSAAQKEAMASAVIVNSGSLAELRLEILRALKQIRVSVPNP